MVDNWQQTTQDIKDVLYSMWVENKITKTEYQKLFMSMNGGPIGTDDAVGHKPLTLLQRAETWVYMKKFGKLQNNS